ncbi:MAG: hypothetical protein GTO08_03435, partial [Deltaproteobacteria bacterium]|nr:hypothetical protein [Deltaproteobacteria bacterium]
VDDIDVSRNWWGSSDPAYVETRVYDGRDQEGIGIATYEPYLEKPSISVSGVKGFLIFKKQGFRGRVYAIKDLDRGFSDSFVFAESDNSG